MMGIRKMAFLLVTGVIILIHISPVIANETVFRIGGVNHELKNICGFTKAELKADFDKNVTKMSNEGIRGLLEKQGFFLRKPEMRKVVLPRSEMESLLWNRAFHQMLDSSVRIFVLAHITNAVAKEHDIQLEDYFDLNTVGDAYRRQAGFLEFLYAKKDDPSESDERLHLDAVKKFQISATKDQFISDRKTVRGRPFFDRWSLDVMQGNEDTFVRAMLTHYLFRQACETGVFRGVAKNRFVLQNSTLTVMEINGFSGAPAALRDSIRLITTKDNGLVFGGAVELKNWLTKTSSKSNVRLSSVFGTKVLAEFGDPVIGHVYEPSPKSYRVFFWQGKPSDPKTENEQRTVKIFLDQISYRIACSDYLPAVETFVPGWELNLEGALSAIGVPGQQLVIPEVRIGNFQKKPYPEKTFQDILSYRVELDNLAMKAFAASLTKDATALNELIQTIDDRRKQNLPGIISGRFRGLSDSLNKVSKK